MLYQIPGISEEIDRSIEKAAAIKGIRKYQYAVLAMGEHAKEVINKEKERIKADA